MRKRSKTKGDKHVSDTGEGGTFTVKGEEHTLYCEGVREGVSWYRSMDDHRRFQMEGQTSVHLSRRFCLSGAQYVNTHILALPVSVL